MLLLCFTGIKAQTFTLQGRVTDSEMNPVELATVAVVQQGKMTMTNLKGEFSMKLQSSDSVVVRFSMVGYKTKTRVLRRPKGKQTLLIQLYDDNQLAGVTVTEHTETGHKRHEKRSKCNRKCRRGNDTVTSRSVHTQRALITI